MLLVCPQRSVDLAQAGPYLNRMEKHAGSCHCGKFRFEVTVDITKGMECNCSICVRKGHVLSFAPPEAFAMTAGSEDALTVYKFNKHVIHHAFCPTCGIAAFGWGTGQDGKKMYSINLRCLDDIDMTKVKISLFDGRNR